MLLFDRAARPPARPGELIPMPFDQIWVTALTGGVAGAVMTLVAQGAFRWWRRPILDIAFSDGEEGCRVPVEGVLVDPKTYEPLKHPATGKQRQGKLVYLRLKLRNRGLTFARNVTIFVTNITYRAAGTGAKTFEEEVFELSLAQTAGDTLVFNLASRGHRFADLVHTAQDDQGQLSFVLDFGKAAHRLVPLNFGEGEYTAKVFVAAENAKSLKRDIRWSYGATVDSLRIVPSRRSWFRRLVWSDRTT